MNLLLETSLSNAAMAVLLAIVAACVTRVCRRPALSHTLWLLVLLKLITPPLVAVPVYFPSLPTLASILPEPKLAAGTDEASAEALMIADESPDAELQADAAGSASVVPEVAPIAPAYQQFPWWNVLLGTWLLGSLFWFATAAVKIGRFHRLLRYAKPAPEPLQDRTRELADRIGLARCPEVWLVPISVSPLLWAVGRPARLVMPASLFSRLGPDEQAALLAHELAHLKRHDHWVRWVELIAIGLYWWHPVSWWARRQIERNEEECCDAWVVWSLPGTAVDYAKALLKTVDFLAEARPALPPAASGAGHVHTLRRRVAMILNRSSDHRLSWVARGGALLLGLTVLPLAPHRLVAQDAQDWPDAVRSNVAIDVVDVTDQDDDDDDGQSGDIEARLRRLEKRLDEVAAALRGVRQPAEPRAPREPREPRRPVPPVRPTPPARPERGSKDLGSQEQQLKEQMDHIAAVAKQYKDSFAKTVDVERLKKLAKEYEEAAKQNPDPESLKKLAQGLEQSIKESIDTKQIEKLSRELEESIKNSINPEQMEQIGKQIEQLIKENVNPEQFEKLTRQFSEMRGRQPEGQESAERAKANAERAKERAEANAERARERAEANEERAKERAAANAERAKKAAKASEDRAKKIAEMQAAKQKEGKKAEQGSADAKPETQDGPKATTRRGRGSADSKPKDAPESGEVNQRIRSLEERLDRILDELKSRKDSSK